MFVKEIATFMEVFSSYEVKLDDKPSPFYFTRKRIFRLKFWLRPKEKVSGKEFQRPPRFFKFFFIGILPLHPPHPLTDYYFFSPGRHIPRNTLTRIYRQKSSQNHIFPSVNYHSLFSTRPSDIEKNLINELVLNIKG